jgi:hypothetical protein
LIPEHGQEALVAAIARAQMCEVLAVARLVEAQLGDQRLVRERVVRVDRRREQHHGERREHNGLAHAPREPDRVDSGSAGAHASCENITNP